MKSSIPKSARERLLTTHPEGQKCQVEYVLGGKVVGVRYFLREGTPEIEYGLQGGRLHGMRYDFMGGHLLSAEPYVNGLVHGVARQWSQEGRLLGAYRMNQGTGIDLWRSQRGDGSPYLAEVHYIKRGRPHGFEWWINENQSTVHWERLWRQGQPHGIERQWTGRRLERGYPRFHLRGKRVSKVEYLKACVKDKSLPRYRQEDDCPERRFPPEIRRKLHFPQDGAKKLRARVAAPLMEKHKEKGPTY